MSKTKRRKSTVVIKDTGLKVSIKDRNNFKKGMEDADDILHLCSTATSTRSTNPRYDCLKRYYVSDFYWHNPSIYYRHGIRYQIATEMYRVDHEAAVRDKIPAPISIKRAVGL